MSDTHRDPDFASFLMSVGANTYKKITGLPPEKLKSWPDLFSNLAAFGSGNSPARKKLFDCQTLGEVAFFSSSETLMAVPLLLRADLGEIADKFAQECRWWSIYDRTADERTRSIIARLMGNS
jgi:hypothetical protein